jgi:hypothetical protein
MVPRVLKGHKVKLDLKVTKVMLLMQLHHKDLKEM